jgi:hypothetical protein
MKIMYRAIAVMLMSMELVFTTGCVNPNGTQNNTGTGALIGGAIGALAGAAGGGRYTGQRALFGAAVGALSGALIGNMIDREQQQRLQQQSPQTWNKLQNNDSIYANSPPPLPTTPTGAPYAAPIIVGAQGLKFVNSAPRVPSLSLSSGGQLYVYGMATGGAAPSGAFASGQSVQISNPNGNVSAELAATTESSNSYTTGTANDAFGGFGVSGFNFVQGFYGVNPGPGPNLQASVSFTLSAPALVVVMGVGSSQATLHFSGLDNPTIDVLNQTIDGVHEPVLAVEHEYLQGGTYTIQEATGDGTAFYQTPANEVDLLGVYIFSTSPNTASSGNPQIPLPAYQPQLSTSSAATPSTPPTATATSAPQMQPFTVDDIKALTAAGVKPDAINKEIEISQSKFSPQDIAAAQQANPPIDPAVIACMQSHSS